MKSSFCFFMNKKSILEASLHQLKAYFLPFLQLFTGAELALVPIANITVDHVSPNADVVFLEGYNLLTAFPGLSLCAMPIKTCSI